MQPLAQSLDEFFFSANRETRLGESAIASPPRRALDRSMPADPRPPNVVSDPERGANTAAEPPRADEAAARGVRGGSQR